MPDKDTLQRAQADKRAGKSANTQAGEFVKQEMDHIREGKHGAKNAKQAIAIGLSEARRAGVDIPDNPNRKGSAKATRSGAVGKKRSVSRSSSSAKRNGESTSKRAKASLKALKKEPRAAASHRALSRQAHSAAKKRTAASRSASARKAARTRAAEGR